MGCRVCRIDKKFPYGNGKKVRQFIQILCETETDYIRLSKLVWKYEFGISEKPLSTTTVWRHRKFCLDLPSPRENKKKSKSVLTEEQKKQQQMIEELKALQS